MPKRVSNPITQSAKDEHERPLTQTIPIVSTDGIPPGYQRIPVKSGAIFAKAQVLSSKCAQPIFVETDPANGDQRVAYWVHPDIVPDLADWLSYRVFPISDLVDED